jgi:hypothetical protein
METQAKISRQIKIVNLGKRHHIFGAIGVHDKPEKPMRTLHQLQELGPGGNITMSEEHFKFFDDAAMRLHVDTREFQVLLDGKDIRPDLERREMASARGPALPSDSAATQESSVLAEILATGDAKAE